MKTARYIIQLTASTKEHRQVKQQVKMIYDGLRLIVEGDIDFYVQPIETSKKKGNKLYLLGKGSNLQL